MSRYETYLRKIAGEDIDISNMPEPSDRIEGYLKTIAENGTGVDPEEIAEIVTDWLDDHVDPETGYVIDNTLLVEGAAADAKKVGDELADVKSAIDDVNTVLNIQPTSATGTGYLNGGFVVLIDGLNLASGVEYTVKFTTAENVGQTTYLYIFDSENTTLKSDTIASGSNTKTFTYTPNANKAGCSIKLYNNSSDRCGATAQVTWENPEQNAIEALEDKDVELEAGIRNLDDKIDEVAQGLYDIDTITAVRRVVVTPVEGKFINTSGTETSNSSYYYVVLDVTPGETIPLFRAYYNNSTSVVSASARFVCAYVNGVANNSKGAENATSYTVPDGVTKIACSFLTTYMIAGYIPVYYSGESKQIKTNAKVESVAFAGQPQKVTGDLAASSSLRMVTNSVKKNTDISFFGRLGSMSKLTIGKGVKGDTNGEYIEIDSTNVKLYRQNQEAETTAHELTFADYIYVCISIGQDYIPTITVMTNGGNKTITTTRTWVGDDPELWVESDASTALTDCSLAFVCRDTDEPLWIFGDSYVSFAADRWLYYAHALGFDGYLVNGYSGEASYYGLMDLNNLLQRGTPKYLIWALGINDADGNSAVNPVWNSVFGEVKALCDEIGCVLIPCTIPNVPERSNVYKNAVVEASGLTYIDFATAVGAHDDTTWYTGMLSNDNLHPTIEGAKALFAQVVKDFPYLCVK